jgi:coenzyme Q-binding protein COQ10
MPRVEQQVVIQAPAERVFGVIVDYERYPEFLPELKSVTLLSRDDGVALVHFDVELIMRVQYTLRLVEDAPLSVKWTLAEAKVIASNTGNWRLQPLPDASCQAVYGLEVKLAGLIPKSVSTRLMGTNLPQMLQRFKVRAEALHGRDHAAETGATKGA